MLLRIMGVVFVVLITIGLAYHFSGQIMVATLFYGGCAALSIGIIARTIGRR